MGACFSGASGSRGRYSLNDIRLATQNFNESNVIAEGASCVVYRGTLNNQGVAVKKLRNTADADARFASEMGYLRQFSHPGIVDFLGFCDEGEERILVFECRGGSLSNKLHENSSSDSVLDWPQRLKIAKDVADGLCHLHGQGIVHDHIASRNILLDENLNAKICDFGMAKRARDIKDRNRNWDVFFFGVLLFELLSGQRPRSGGIQGFDSLIESNSYREICHSAIRSVVDGDSLTKFVVLATRCKRNDGTLTMKEVFRSLSEIRIPELEANQPNGQQALWDDKIAEPGRQ